MVEAQINSQEETNTNYPPDLVTLALDHVNGVSRSKVNEVTPERKNMMIKSLLGISTRIYTTIKC